MEVRREPRHASQAEGGAARKGRGQWLVSQKGPRCTGQSVAADPEAGMRALASNISGEEPVLPR